MITCSVSVIRHSPLVTFRRAACLAALWLAPGMAQAAPVYTISTYTTDLVARLDWSSDLGLDVINGTGSFDGTGVPVSISASAVRAGRLVSANITQTAPYVLADQYWAASWSGTLSVPGPGYYGLFAQVSARTHWNFVIPGLTFDELANTPFYFASRWDITAPADIHPGFEGPGIPPPPSRRNPVVPPSHGSGTGSFTSRSYGSYGPVNFLTRPIFQASTYSGDVNLPGTMDFSYQIAFSTTPIDASVFDPPVSQVPAPATFLMLLAPVAGLGFIARRSTRRG